jgi:hypothetical protein
MKTHTEVSLILYDLIHVSGVTHVYLSSVSGKRFVVATVVTSSVSSQAVNFFRHERAVVSTTTCI